MLDLKRLDFISRAKRAARDAWRNRVGVRLLDGQDYEAYRATQTAGNKSKITQVYAHQENIAHLARYATKRCGPALRVLCHGSRNGAEVQWFKQHLPDAAAVLGTDISDTAAQFPDTVQWDFHEPREDWLGAWDVIYSNSWDHAYDPKRAFRNWMECLTPRGVLLLEHSIRHTPAYVTKLDPFGATVPALRDILASVGTGEFVVADTIDDLPCRRDGQRIIVVTAKQQL